MFIPKTFTPLSPRFQPQLSGPAKTPTPPAARTKAPEAPASTPGPEEKVPRVKRTGTPMPSGGLDPKTMSAQFLGRNPPGVLAKGSSGPEVTQLQRDLGMGEKGQTGQFGPTTENEVKKFQRAHGLAADGRVGEGTKAALRTATEDRALEQAMKEKRVFKEGDSGPEVKAIQRLLGFGPGGQTGVMGKDTMSALAEQKTKLGLGRANEFGPATFEALKSQGPTATGNRLAQNIQDIVGGNTDPHNQCWTKVADALEGVGLGPGRNIVAPGSLYGMSAHSAANQLAGNPKFKEVTGLSPNDLPNLPAGAVVVWGPFKPGQADVHAGHVSIALGDGREASDFVGPQTTRHHTYGDSFRVFMPK
ncbi:MAG: peptidoglycan-binding protein [Deltaproteobacteria bacterium]|nr:peptidoglycan-binding protein [Deltaproteobacteria bacterium]